MLFTLARFDAFWSGENASGTAALTFFCNSRQLIDLFLLVVVLPKEDKASVNIVAVAGIFANKISLFQCSKSFCRPQVSQIIEFVK